MSNNEMSVKYYSDFRGQKKVFEFFSIRKICLALPIKIFVSQFQVEESWLQKYQVTNTSGGLHGSTLGKKNYQIK